MAESPHQHAKAIITTDALEDHTKKKNHLLVNFARFSSLESLCNLVLMATNILTSGKAHELKQNS